MTTAAGEPGEVLFVGWVRLAAPLGRLVWDSKWTRNPTQAERERLSNAYAREYFRLIADLEE